MRSPFYASDWMYGAPAPQSLAAIEGDLTRQINAAELREQRAGLPPAVRALLEPGADVATRWKAMPIAAQRRVLDGFLEVKIRPSGHNRYKPIEDRVAVTRRDRHAGVSLTTGDRAAV